MLPFVPIPATVLRRVERVSVVGLLQSNVWVAGKIDNERVSAKAIMLHTIKAIMQTPQDNGNY